MRDRESVRCNEPRRTFWWIEREREGSEVIKLVLKIHRIEDGSSRGIERGKREKKRVVGRSGGREKEEKRAAKTR